MAGALSLALAACGGVSHDELNGASGGRAGAVAQAGHGQAGASPARAGTGGNSSGGARASTGGSSMEGAGRDARAGEDSGGRDDTGGSGGAGRGGAGRGGTGGGGGGARGGRGGASVGGETASGGRAGNGAGGQSSGFAGTAQAGTPSLGALEPAVKAYCGAVTSCCGSSLPLDVCETTYAGRSANFASLAAGTVTVDAAQLAQCQAAYAGANQCDQNTVWAACRNVFIGTRAVNEPCKNGFDCDRSAGTMTCLITDTSNPDAEGTCIPAPRAALGDACVSTCEPGDSCVSTTFGVGDTYSLCFAEDGLYCAYVGPGSVCKALVPLGSPCSNEQPECGSGAYCDTTCKPLSDVGAACGDGCRSELQCDDATGKCVDPTWATDYGCTMGYAPGL